jgi:hypothetical protein
MNQPAILRFVYWDAMPLSKADLHMLKTFRQQSALFGMSQKVHVVRSLMIQI